MSLILTVDVGTTSVKAGLFDQNMKPVCFTFEEYTLETPSPEYVELSPSLYWQAIKKTVIRILADSSKHRSRIAAIAITTQGETIIPVDGLGNVLHNAVVWLDARADKEVTELSTIIQSDEYYHTTGMTAFGPATPLCKLLWFKRNRKSVYEQTYKFLLLSDYIVFLMTGQMATEKTMMSSTGYYDIFHRTIWDEGLKKAGLDPEKIPSVKDSGEEIGRLNTSVAKELGITPGVPVLIAANDQMCSAVGGGNIVPGIITETTGTCLVAITTVDPPAFGQKAALEYNLHVNDKYIILQYAKTAGYILKWFKDEFCREEQKTCKRTGKHIYELMGQMAANIPPGSCGLTLYPYFAGKLSPQNQPAAKGVFFNVGLGVKKDHFVRAILEGVAYMLKENLDFIEENGVPIQQIRTLGGGSKSTIWNQIKADVCNKPVTVLQCEETTSMGAAIIASLALGWFSTFEEACHCCVLTEKIFFPDEKHAKFYQQSFKLYKKLDKSMRALYAKL